MLSYIKNKWDKYELNFPLIKRKFDSIFINYKQLNSSLWYFFDDIFLDNILLGISKFGEKFLFYSLDLKNVIEEENIILDYKNKKIKIITSFKNINFDFYIDEKIFYIKNKVLNSIICKKEVIFKDIKDNQQNIEKIEKSTNILDIYFLKNFFIQSKNEVFFNEKIGNFMFENIKNKSDFLPKNILKVNEKWYIKIQNNVSEKIFFWRKRKNIYEKLKFLKTFLEFKNFYNLKILFIQLVYG